VKACAVCVERRTYGSEGRDEGNLTSLPDRWRLSMDVAAFRKVVAASLGNDLYPNFVQQLRRAGRLRYWQERLWSQFVDAHPEFSCSVEELQEVLLVCELHGCELQPDEVEVFDGCIDYSDRYIKAKIWLFPNAATGPVSREGHPLESRTARVWFCAECRAAEAALGSRRA
jgi:hypothetical protein